MRALRLATRSSRLALWQTNAVVSRLTRLGSRCETVSLNSTGDIDLVKPIYELGVQGVFTKELDIALLNGDADAAVHSLKDIPIVLAKGLRIAAVLERASFQDILITKKEFRNGDQPFTLATSSIRRKAQWLEKYPHHRMENVRGNVETRIKKLHDSDWDGLLMAKAAVDRLDLKLQHTLALEWMLPAPGQGAIAIVCREDDEDTIYQLIPLNHVATATVVGAERQFLHELKGGCSAPISALASIENNLLNFNGAVHSLDGKSSFHLSKKFPKTSFSEAGKIAAEEVLHTPEGTAILKEIFHDRPEMKL
jgi:hydroxymethylbilane synthase